HHGTSEYGMNDRYGGIRAGVQPPEDGQRRIFAMTALGRIRDSLLLLVLAMLPVTPLMASAAAAEAAQARTVLVIGDSLSAGYGLAADEGWVSLTAERLRAAHPGWRIVNASIS